MKSMRPGEANKRGNVVTARIVPLLLLGIIGYSSWVVTDRVCLKYLINPPASLSSHRDTGAAVAILVIFYLLLLITLICFGRLIGTILTRPGLVPRGEQYWIEKERKRRDERRETSPTRKEEALGYALADTEGAGYTPRKYRRRQDQEAQSFRAHEFWQKDVFVCGWDGRPPFCSTCYNYKPDRAHHCRELGRCVLKMDHFCPWVGGIISETSFKFFIQFTGWAALFCLHALVVMAYYFARRRSEEPGFLNVHWILTLVFAGLFFFFAAGMCGSSLQLAALNSTTIENFTRKTKIWYLAVYLPPRVLEKCHASGQSDLRLISYPRPPEEQFQILQRHGATLSNDSDQAFTRQVYVGPASPERTYHPSVPTSPGAAPSAVQPHPAEKASTTTSPPTSSSSQPNPDSLSQQRTDIPSSDSTSPPAPEPRTFAILESRPGANPFDIGPAGNFKEVMGYTLLDWLFPLKPSPLVNHSDPLSMYKLGPVVRRMKSKAGISVVEDEDEIEGASEGVIVDGRDPGVEATRAKRSRNRSGSQSRSRSRSPSRTTRRKDGASRSRDERIGKRKRKRKRQRQSRHSTSGTADVDGEKVR
jgi:palmitoyltransferase